MSVVSIFDILGSEKESPPDFSKILNSANHALGDVFKTIALEKNQLLYQPTSELVNNPHHHIIIAAAAKKLIATLQEFSAHAQLLPEIQSNIQLLEKAINAYQTSELALSQLLLACSSIKINLEKYRSSL